MEDGTLDPRLAVAGRAARLVATACGATLAQADAAHAAAVGRLRHRGKGPQRQGDNHEIHHGV